MPYPPLIRCRVRDGLAAVRGRFPAAPQSDPRRHRGGARASAAPLGLASGRLRVLIALGCLAAAPAALAAQPDATDLLNLPFDDLLAVKIRSAGKREEELRDIPASVTIVTREEIARYGWVTFEELLRSVPGFYLLDNTEDRFVGTRGAVGGGVQFLVNGIPQHPSLQKTLTGTEIARLDIPVESIDRVEIIRGPMSVIYGNNAFQGVVNVVTNAIDRNGPRVSAGLGSRRSGEVFGRLGTVWADGFVVLNLGGYRTDGLGGAYADMLGPAQLAKLQPGMRQGLDGDLDQRLGSLDVSAQWHDWQVKVRLNRRDYGIYAFTPPFDEGSRIQLDTLHASLGYAHRFSDDLGLRITGIYSSEHYDAYQLDFVRPEFGGEQRQSSRRLEVEADLHWRPAASLDTIAGYRLLEVYGVRNRAFLPPFIDGLRRLEPVVSHDLFAEASWQANPRLRLVGGLRLSLLPDSYRETTQRRPARRPRQLSFPNQDTTPLNGRIALLWSPRPSQVLKVAWGTASQDTDQINLPEAERIETWEVNYTLTQPRWMLNAGVFQNRLSRLTRTLQSIDPATGTYLSQDDNSGRWETRGLELIAQAQPLPALDLSASLTWQRTEDTEGPAAPGYSPALLAKLKADWRRGPLTFAAYGNYVAPMQADWNFVAGPVQGLVARIGEEVPGYWDLGLNLRWDPSGHGPYASLHVSNLLDAEIRYPANELADFARGLIGPGRVLTLTLGYAF